MISRVRERAFVQTAVADVSNHSLGLRSLPRARPRSLMACPQMIDVVRMAARLEDDAL